MGEKSRAVVRGGVFFGLALSLCHCRSDEQPPEPAPRPSNPSAPNVRQPKRAPSQAALKEARGQGNPRQIVSNFPIGSSAYRTSLTVDGRVATLVTESAVVRFTPGGEPERRTISIDSEPAFTKSAVIFWQNGELRALPKSFGEVRTLGQVQTRPYQLLASDEHVAWVEKDAKGRFSVQSLKDRTPEVLFRSEGTLTTAAMMQRSVYFVENTKDGSFRLGSVPLDGGQAVFTKKQPGRTPSMLIASGGALYYFLLAGRKMTRVSADLSETRVLARNIVCSPLSVSDKIYCARVEGIFALPLEGGDPEVLTTAPLGLTARISASSELLAWVSEDERETSTLRLMWTSP